MEIYKKLLRIVLIVGSFLFVIDKAYADEFYPSGDGVYCHFSTATSISYDDLPTSCSSEGCISYNRSHLLGQSGDYPENHTIEDLVDFTPGSLRKYPNIASAVSVPPNTEINVGIYVDNASGHEVEILQSYLFLSRADRSLGDWNRLGADTGTIGWRSYEFRDDSVRRYGRYITLGNLGIYPNRGNSPYPYGRSIYSFKSIQPLNISSSFSSYHFEGKDMIVEYSIEIENTSEYNLSNISIEDVLPGGEVYSNRLSINSGERIELIYESNVGSRYESPIVKSPAKVSDPNFHREAAAISGVNIYDDNPEIRTLIIDRDDDGAPDNWSARQPDFSASPSMDYHYVQLIPYTLFANQIEFIPPQPEFILEKRVSDSDEIKVRISNSYVGEELIYDIHVTNNGGYAEGFRILDQFDSSLLEIVKVELIIDDQVVEEFLPQSEQNILLEGLWLEHGVSIHFRVYGRILELALKSGQIDNVVELFEDDDLIATDSVLTRVSHVVDARIEIRNKPEVLGETGFKYVGKTIIASVFVLWGLSKGLISLLSQRI
jgi:hypothetical protein